MIEYLSQYELADRYHMSIDTLRMWRHLTRKGTPKGPPWEEYRPFGRPGGPHGRDQLKDVVEWETTNNITIPTPTN